MPSVTFRDRPACPRHRAGRKRARVRCQRAGAVRPGRAEHLQRGLERLAGEDQHVRPGLDSAVVPRSGLRVVSWPPTEGAGSAGSYRNEEEPSPSSASRPRRPPPFRYPASWLPSRGGRPPGHASRPAAHPPGPKRAWPSGPGQAIVIPGISTRRRGPCATARPSRAVSGSFSSADVQRGVSQSVDGFQPSGPSCGSARELAGWSMRARLLCCDAFGTEQQKVRAGRSSACHHCLEVRLPLQNCQGKHEGKTWNPALRR